MKTNLPTHEEVAQRAHHIWNSQGNPEGRDNEIWFEAERQLQEEAVSNQPSSPQGRGNGNSQSSATPADPTAADLKNGHLSGHPIPSPNPIEVAAKAEQQKKKARAPQLADTTAHRPAPPESGKPVWDRPHSR